MPILLMLNMKGGVAKTTNTVAIAECLADQGRKVLVIDADHQCTSSELLIGQDRLGQCEHRGRTLHDLLAAMLEDEFEAACISPFVMEGVSNIGEGYPNLHLIPCSIRIDDFSTNMAKARRGHHSMMEWVNVLDKKRRILHRYFRDEYDFVLVDCPPSLAMQVQQFLRFGDGLIIPCIPDHLSVRGTRYLLDRLRRGNFTRIKPIGTLWSLYREQAATHRQIVEDAAWRKGEFNELPPPFKTIIPNAAKIAESTEANHQPRSFTAKYTPQFAHLYQELCGEILKRLRDLEIGE